MMDRQVIISVRGLTKSYGDLEVLKGVSFDMFAGETIGLVGPNGSGKTTLILLLTGYLRANAGTVNILGIPITCGTHDRRVGFVPDRPSFYPFFTPIQHLRMVDSLNGGRLTEGDCEAALAGVGLHEARHRKIGTFSRGMLQRMCWAELVAGDAAVILLDEPTSALDPRGIVDLRKFVTERAQAGAAVFFSSHNLDEVERICTRVLLMQEKKCEPLDRSAVQAENRFEVRLRKYDESKAKGLSAFTQNVERQGNTLWVTVADGVTIGELFEQFSAAGLEVTGIVQSSAYYFETEKP